MPFSLSQYQEWLLDSKPWSLEDKASVLFLYYHCYPTKNYFKTVSLSLPLLTVGLDSNPWSLDNRASVLPLLPNQKQFCNNLSLSSTANVVLDSNPWPSDDKVSVLQLYYHRFLTKGLFFNLQCQRQRLYFYLKMLKWVFYHYTTAAGQANCSCYTYK